jgi:hypothetical protein
MMGALALALAAMGAGCHSPQPVPRVAVPSAGNGVLMRPAAPEKPLPPQEAVDDRPFADEPIIKQALPGEGNFVQAYRQVGAPRIVLFVNRTLEGNIIPVTNHQPLVSVEQTRTSSTGVTVQQRETYSRQGYANESRHEQTDRYQSNGPSEYHERTEVYLRPGEYDEVAARSLDYQAVETIMTDWLRANGAVEVVSPTMARGRLSDEQIKELQSGRPRSMAEIARQLDADVLIQVQAHPTRQTPQGLQVRMVAEAISLRGGQSLGDAVVDVPPPLDKVRINTYTRYLASKLMDDMTQTWANAPAPAAPAPSAPAGPATGSTPPATQPGNGGPP